MTRNGLAPVVVGIVLCVTTLAVGAVAPPAGDLLRLIGVRKGICAILGDRKCELAMALARDSELTLYVQLTDAADVEAARRAVDASGMYNRRIYVERGDLRRIHLADNICDAVVVVGEPAGIAQAELLRVLRPGGKVLLGDRELVKPAPDGIDDWSHHYHGPDNNPQSRDQLARAPFLTQFVADPRYMACPQAVVAAGGRIFAAAGHIAWHRREEPTLNTLMAVNGYNGTILWRRPLTRGIVVDRNTMIATPTTLYLGDEASCKLIDPASGKVRDEIVPPVELTGGTFWKWMALENGVLYAMVGQAETKKVLWYHKEDIPIDSRGVCMKNGRIYICSFGNYLACLDARNGAEIWRKTPAEAPKLFEAIGSYRPGHGWARGWKSAVYLKCTDEALYFVGPQTERVTAVSAADGRLLWSLAIGSQHAVIRKDGFYMVGTPGKFPGTSKLDPLSGKLLAKYPVSRNGCTRPTGGPDGIFFRDRGGSVRLDLATGKPQWISPMRPSCQVGVIIANGQLYWIPWACDCNLQMFGIISLCPSGDFEFNRQATEAERLETGPGDITQVAAFKESEDDWRTYRADNARSSRTNVRIPKNVKLLWRFTPKVEFEPTAPVAAGGLVLISGSDGVVRAFEAKDGQVRWRAYTGGAVRFSPTITEGRVLVGSADGWTYAFEAATGRLLWRFRAAPAERKIPFYGRLVSTWPVASGVLVEDGTAYFAAGINNYDGTHVYALDVASGRIKWQNNTSGHLDPFSRRGVSVQGNMLSRDGMLYMPGGNAVSPAIYDMATGKCLNNSPQGSGSKASSGRELRLSPDGYAVRRGELVKTKIVTVYGQPLYSQPKAPLYSWRRAPRDVPAVITRYGRLSWAEFKESTGPVWKLMAHDPPKERELWNQSLPAPPLRWGIAMDAAGRVVVALRNGEILCFGGE